MKQRHIYGNFPLEAYKLEVRCGTEFLGEGPHFSLEKIEPDDFIRFVASIWKVLEISDDIVELLPADPPPEAETKSFQYLARAWGLRPSSMKRCGA